MGSPFVTSLRDSFASLPFPGTSFARLTIFIAIRTIVTESSWTAKSGCSISVSPHAANNLAHLLIPYRNPQGASLFRVLVTEVFLQELLRALLATDNMVALA
jgi:hypothetical protein